MVSVATAMIPFLEHDDANRALMGLEHAAPVGAAAGAARRRWSATGMEYRARDRRGRRDSWPTKGRRGRGVQRGTT